MDEFIITMLGSVLAYNIMVAKRAGLAINGIAMGTRRGSSSAFNPSPIFGKRILIAVKRRIIPEAMYAVVLLIEKALYSHSPKKEKTNKVIKE